MPQRPKELNRRSSDTVIYSDAMDGPRTEQQQMEVQRQRLEALANFTPMAQGPAAGPNSARAAAGGPKRGQPGLSRSQTVGSIGKQPGSKGRRGSAEYIGPDAFGVANAPPPGASEGVPPERGAVAARPKANRSPHKRVGSTTYELPLDNGLEIPLGAEEYDMDRVPVADQGRTDSGRGDGLGLREATEVINDHAIARKRLPSMKYRNAQRGDEIPYSEPFGPSQEDLDEGLDFEYEEQATSARAAAARGTRSASPHTRSFDQDAAELNLDSDLIPIQAATSESAQVAQDDGEIVMRTASQVNQAVHLARKRLNSDEWSPEAQRTTHEVLVSFDPIVRPPDAAEMGMVGGGGPPTDGQGGGGGGALRALVPSTRPSAYVGHEGDEQSDTDSDYEDDSPVNPTRRQRAPSASPVAALELLGGNNNTAQLSSTAVGDITITTAAADADAATSNGCLELVVLFEPETGASRRVLLVQRPHSPPATRTTLLEFPQLSGPLNPAQAIDAAKRHVIGLGIGISAATSVTGDVSPPLAGAGAARVVVLKLGANVASQSPTTLGSTVPLVTEVADLAEKLRAGSMNIGERGGAIEASPSVWAFVLGEKMSTVATPAAPAPVPADVGAMMQMLQMRGEHIVKLEREKRALEEELEELKTANTTTTEPDPEPEPESELEPEPEPEPESESEPELQPEPETETEPSDLESPSSATQARRKRNMTGVAPNNLAYATDNLQAALDLVKTGDEKDSASAAAGDAALEVMKGALTGAKLAQGKCLVARCRRKLLGLPLAPWSTTPLAKGGLQKEMPPTDMSEEQLVTLVLQAFGMRSAPTELELWEGVDKLTIDMTWGQGQVGGHDDY